MSPWRVVATTVLHPETEIFTVESHYIDALDQAGADMAMIPWVTTDAEAERRLTPFDGLVLTGGQDIDPAAYGAAVDGAVEVLPAADNSDARLIHAAQKQGKPILAVCRGAQVLNVAFGGTLTQHMWGRSEDHPEPLRTGDKAADAVSFLANRHAVALDPDSQVAAAFCAESISANSLHHQSIDKLGADLMITGRAPDGTVEVVEHTTHPAIGVQWHPEWLQAEGHDALFTWIVEQAANLEGAR